MLNNHGHSDWSGLLWLFIISVVVCVLVEGSFIALAIFIRNLPLRIVFGCLAVAGAIFIIHYLKELG